MKKPYQIESQRAVKQLEAMAADGNPAVQMVLPMAEMVGWLRQGRGRIDSSSRLAVDGSADAGRSPGAGRRAQPAAGGKDGQSVGQRARLLRGDGAEGSGRAAARAHDRRPGSAVGQLRDVPPRRAADGNGLGEVDARPEHEEIRPGGARSSPKRTVWRRARSASISSRRAGRS